MKKNISNWFGIDFGTTTSATVGILKTMGGNSNMLLYGDEEERPIPSVIAIDKVSGEVFTGRTAWNKKMELSETCEYITSVKTLLGTEWRKTIAGRVWTAVDLAAEVMKSLRKVVQVKSNVEMDTATVAIPINFSAKKREELRQAALLAGIKITSFISEPTAAFFANYQELRSASTIAVFDWGGGTLDVSVLRNSEGKVSELAVEGLNIGGDNIDRKIAERLHAKIFRDKKIDQNIGFDGMPNTEKDLLLVKSEQAKRDLSDDDDAFISLPNYGGYGTCRQILYYDWFADIIKPEVDRAIECLEKAIRESGVGKANLDRIVLVGGSSNLRPLLDKMEKEYGDLLYFPEETMWNAGQGAARLAKYPGEYYSNQSLGVTLSNGDYFEVLKPDTNIHGWKNHFTFGLVDTTEEARFVFSGSSDLDESALEYRSLEVPSYNFLQEKIFLKVKVDENHVFIAEAGSGMRPAEYQRIWEYGKLKCYYKLPETEVKKWN